MVLGESLIQNFLVQSLSAYFDNVDRDNVSVAIVRGDVTLNGLHLRRSALNQFGSLSKSLRLVHGTVGLLRARVPWHRFGMAPIVFELEDLFLLLEEMPEETIVSESSDTELDKLRESANELMKEVAAEESPDTTTSSSWGGWFKSAGRFAKRIVDSMEIQIKIRNVHIRFTSDSGKVPFSMGLVLDQLAVSTTTQMGSPKILNMSNFAIYLNPEHEMEDAVEELDPDSDSTTTDQGNKYVLEPISGTMTFVTDGDSFAVSGEYDSVVVKLTTAQLDTSIYNDLKSILVKTASNPQTRGMLSAAATAAYNSVTSPAVSDDESDFPRKSVLPKSWLKISLSLNRAIVRSVSLDVNDASVDFICDNIFVSGDIAEASAMSRYSFKMEKLNIVTSDMKKVILGANPTESSSPQDFVSITVKIKEESLVLAGPPAPPIDIIFSLGPVYFGFHPKIVSAILCFVKSFPSSGGADKDDHPDDQAAPLVTSPSPPSPRSSKPKIRIQFMWESMALDWFSLEDDQLFLKSQMTRSYVCLEMLDTVFISRGELGDFSLTHVPASQFEERSILGLANPEGTDSYLFKFYVRSWDESLSDFPGYHTEMEFHLSAVRLLVVKSVLMRLWYYIFDAFLPGLTGGLSSGEVFQEMEEGENVGEKTIPPPARKYKLFVNLERLDLLTPLSVTSHESNPGNLQLRSLTIRNDPNGNTITFDLEEVCMTVEENILFNNIRVTSEFIRGETMRIITRVSDFPIILNRTQFSYLCDLLFFNLSGNAWDGIEETSHAVAASATAMSSSDTREWLRFEFLFADLDLKIPQLADMTISNISLAISKFDSGDMRMECACNKLCLADSSTGEIKVSLNSTAASRTISVSISRPVYQVNIALLLELRAFFFDKFEGYNRPDNIHEHRALTTSGGTPETVFDLSLLEGQIVLSSSERGKFFIQSNLVSLHQNFVSVSETFLRKLVISNASIFFLETSNDAVDENNRILKQMDLFFSSLATGTVSVSYKINCEPVQLRIGFSHLKQFLKAVNSQRKAIAGTTVSTPSSGTAISPSFDRINSEIVFHSLRLLIINDFANYQNTPLFSSVLRDLESTSETVYESRIVSPTSSRAINRDRIIERKTSNLSLEIEIAVFNKSSVEWEPLIESCSDSGNSREIKISTKVTRLNTFDHAYNLLEKANQVIFDVNEGNRGVQLNLSESLISLGVENYANWSSQFSSLDSDSSPTSPTSGGSSFYSPYSVCNMTGEELVEIVWKDDPSRVYKIENSKETQLDGISVLVENSLFSDTSGSSDTRRVLANVSAPFSGWSIPRLAIDRQGVYLHKIPIGGEGAIADLITDIIVTPGDGKKLVSFQSSVLVLNQFGHPLKLRVAGKDVTLGVDQTVPIPLTETVRGGTFKLAREDAEELVWSGSVSIADIRTKKNDLKLWQINLGSCKMYLSAKMRPLTYQDKTCEQMIITVFAPLRIGSSLPVHVHYAIASSTAASRRSSVSSQSGASDPLQPLVERGSIGLNGCDYITSVPLTGRLEIHVSLFEGRVVSRDPVQIWPVNAEDLEQMKHSTNRTFFVPIKLFDSRNNFVSLQLVFDQVEGRPPYITIHSPSWLVCVDCPSLLRFGYETDLEEDENGENAVVCLGTEKSYTVPLDFRAKKIAAILNSTMSEFVAVDTIGAATTITLDAFDDKIKRKVKQELAVRVSSADIVRNFPLKTTTVSPKFVLVNTLKKPIQVKQAFSTMSVAGVSHVSVNPGGQVPFKWWIVDTEDGGKASRLVSVRIAPDGSWSDAINVGEIGERAVMGGIEKSRCEIRLYHGAFYIVFSSTVGEEKIEEDTLSSSPVPIVTNSVYRLLLPSLGVSLIGPSTTRSIDRNEVAFLQIKTLLVNLSLSSVANEVDVRMESLQIDDYRGEPKYPVIFNRTKRQGLEAPVGAMLEVAASWQPPAPGDTVLNFEYITARCGEIDVQIDYSLVSDLTELLRSSTSSKSAQHYPHKHVPSIEVLPIGSLRIWSVKEFSLHQMNVNLSFTPNNSTAANYSVIHRAIASMAAVDRSPLNFNPLILKDFRASRSNLKSIVAEHYKYQMYREMRTLMGSADAFGNPILLVNSVSTGVSDLFSQPLAAIREMQRPEDVLNVADKTAKGAKSFFKNTAFGVFNSFSKLAATSAQSLSILTEDEEFMSERSDFHNKNRPNDVADGVAVGAASFGRGIIAGLSGLVTKPVEGLEQEGIAGLAKGTVKGVGGFFLKPMAGLFDFAKSTADGVVVATKDSSLETQPMRLPRMLYGHDRVVRVINPEHSLLRWYLLQLEGFPPNFSYCSHVYDSANGVIVAVSSAHVVVADTQLRRISLLAPIWRILGVSADHDRLILSILIQIPESMMDVLGSNSRSSSEASFQGTSQFDVELSSVFILRSVQQTIAAAMEV